MNPHLERLKSLNIKKISKALPIKKDGPAQSNYMSFETLDRVLKQAKEDPLTWNPSVLSRVYNVHETILEGVVRYVQPMMYHIASNMDEPKKMMRDNIVIDVGKLKEDNSYYPHLHKLIFVKREKKHVQLDKSHDVRL